jgi:hypothetical protein
MLLFDELLMRHGEGCYLTPKKKNKKKKKKKIKKKKLKKNFEKFTKKKKNKKKKKKSEIITSAENCWIILTITNSSYTTLVNK